MHSKTCLGIDIAQRSFVAALRLASHRWVKSQFANTPAGFRKLARWLQGHPTGPLRVALEATSVYAEALAQWLHEQGHEVYVLNAERVACYARSLGQRNKTDPADAQTIAAFIATHEARRYQPPSPEQRALRSLTRTRQQLMVHLGKLRLQLATADAVAKPHLQAAVRALQAQCKAIEAQMRRHLRACPALEAKVRLLRTCKGAGWLTAAIAVAELPPIDAHSDPRALSAWAGVTPRRHQSGNSESPSWLSRKGNAYLRHALYMPALVAKRHNPLLRAFAQRLKANGKSSNAILGAISHKMLRLFVGILRSNRPFDPNYLPQKI